MRDPRFDVLFEPVVIGPVVAKNRFFQVPHCNGMGYRATEALAAMRGMKAEGGWAVVCTEETEIHPSSDLTPYVELRIWDDRDIEPLSKITSAIHQHGALAGIELVHNGSHVANRSTREAPLGPSARPVEWTDPVQARRMSKSDIAELRGWHREAVSRSIRAGFDLVYVYAGHTMSVIQHFLSRHHNDRADEYGGSLENRARLLREILEDAQEEAAGAAAIACRLCVDELLGPAGLERAEITEVMGMLGELPDLWDFQTGLWKDDSSTARFKQEGYQEEYVRGLKQLTTKPVVGVGRFTSPDEMVRQINSGVMDLIGAARPSIADPFLPAKLEEGRAEEIRECIGCNVCVSADMLSTPVRCTQNPSMGEEWRRGWHPEKIAPVKASAKTPAKVLVIGAGPAGLEAAQALGKRGFEVVVVEGTREVGGRATKEAALPGLASWRRLVDYRLDQIDRLPNVQLFRESPTNADEALGFGFDHIGVATGATWRRDGAGRSHLRPITIDSGAQVLTPDDLMAGIRPRGNRIVIFDDDHYYLGGVLAELLVSEGYSVEIVTPEPLVSAWTVNTLEQGKIHRRMIELGVDLRTQYLVTGVTESSVVVRHTVAGSPKSLECDSVVMITGRLSNDELATELVTMTDRWKDNGLLSVQALGDAWVPSTLASAIWWGHRYARELEEDASNIYFRRELVGQAPE